MFHKEALRIQLVFIHNSKDWGKGGFNSFSERHLRNETNAFDFDLHPRTAYTEKALTKL